jgi:hypothetical protein
MTLTPQLASIPNVDLSPCLTPLGPCIHVRTCISRAAYADFRSRWGLTGRSNACHASALWGTDTNSWGGGAPCGDNVDAAQYDSMRVETSDPKLGQEIVYAHQTCTRRLGACLVAGMADCVKKEPSRFVGACVLKLSTAVSGAFGPLLTHARCLSFHPLIGGTSKIGVRKRGCLQYKAEGSSVFQKPQRN